MNTNVDVDAMRKDAVEIFQKGFACSESVIYAIKKGFDLDLSDDAIAMSSGFPWGLGDGGCICGALAGATPVAVHGEIMYIRIRKNNKYLLFMLAY